MHRVDERDARLVGDEPRVAVAHVCEEQIRRPDDRRSPPGRPDRAFVRLVDPKGLSLGDVPREPSARSVDRRIQDPDAFSLEPELLPAPGRETGALQVLGPGRDDWRQVIGREPERLPGRFGHREEPVGPGDRAQLGRAV